MGTNRLLSPSDTSPRPALLAVKVHEDPQRVRICCTGEIDMSTAEQLVTAVADVLARPGSAVIEMDLAESGSSTPVVSKPLFAAARAWRSTSVNCWSRRCSLWCRGFCASPRWTTS